MRRFTFIVAAETLSEEVTTAKDIAPIDARRATLGNPEYTGVLHAATERSIATAAHLSGKGAGSKPLQAVSWLAPSPDTDGQWLSAKLKELGSGNLEVLARTENRRLAARLNEHSRTIASAIDRLRAAMNSFDHLLVVFEDPATMRATASEFARMIRPFEMDADISYLDGYIFTDHGSGMAVERIAKQ